MERSINRVTDTDLTGEIFFAEGGYGRPEILISGGIKNWVMG